MSAKCRGSRHSQHFQFHQALEPVAVGHEATVLVQRGEQDLELKMLVGAKDYTQAEVSGLVRAKAEMEDGRVEENVDEIEAFPEEEPEDAEQLQQEKAPILAAPKPTEPPIAAPKPTEPPKVTRVEGPRVIEIQDASSGEEDMEPAEEAAVQAEEEKPAEEAAVQAEEVEPAEERAVQAEWKKPRVRCVLNADPT